jgi:hypothetical protein
MNKYNLLFDILTKYVICMKNSDVIVTILK